MHKFLKYILLSFLILVVNFNSSAQLKLPHLQLIANANYATPSNDAFSDASKAGIGVEAGVGLGYGSTMFMGTLGYQRFGATASNTAGDLNITSIKAGVRQYVLLGRLFLLGNIGTAIQSYSGTSTKGSNVIYEFGGGVRLFGLELQLTKSYWQQPINTAASNAFNVKVGFSLKL